MWFKNITIYRLSNWDLALDELEDKLYKNKLRDCASLETKTTGWLTVSDSDNFTFTHQKQILICFGTNKKLIPASVVNKKVKNRVKEITLEQGYELSKKQQKELKKTVTDELLLQAFSVESKIYAWIDPINQWLVINSVSKAKIDDFLGLLHRTIDGVSVLSVKTNKSPSVAMKNWLVNGVDGLFTLDNDCELAATGVNNNRSIKFSGYSVLQNDFQKLLNQGMEVKKLGLTWESKISFALQNTLQLKKLTPLDALKEKYSDEYSNEDIFITEFSAMTNEYNSLFKTLFHVIDNS